MNGMGSVCACCACRSSILCHNYYRHHHHYSSFRKTRYFVAVAKICYEKFCVRYLVQLTVFIALYGINSLVYLDRKNIFIKCVPESVCGRAENQSTRNVFELLCVVLYHLAPFQFMNIHKQNKGFFPNSSFDVFVCIYRLQ